MLRVKSTATSLSVRIQRPRPPGFLPTPVASREVYQRLAAGDNPEASASTAQTA